MAAFKTYFEKSGADGFHIQPWPYYLKLLAFSKSGGGPLWSEALILALALVGIVSAFALRRQKRAVPSPARFIFLYTLSSTAVFSIIPYKTPWNLFHFTQDSSFSRESALRFFLTCSPRSRSKRSSSSSWPGGFTI